MSKQAIRRVPVFVIGYKRSGTTMLRLMLNRHPSLCIPTEWGCFQDIPKRYRNKVHQPQDIDEILTSLPKYYEKIYDKNYLKVLLNQYLPGGNDVLISCLYHSCIRTMGKNEKNCRWGDKKPQHWQFVDALYKWYPEAQFIYLVRDPRDIIASIIDYTNKGINLTRFDFIYNLPLLPTHVILAWHIQYTYTHMKKQKYILGDRHYF